MIFFSLFLASSSCLVFSFFYFLVYNRLDYIIFFPFTFFRFLFFSSFPFQIDLRSVVRMRSNRYYQVRAIYTW